MFDELQAADCRRRRRRHREHDAVVDARDLAVADERRAVLQEHAEQETSSALASDAGAPALSGRCADRTAGRASAVPASRRVFISRTKRYKQRRDLPPVENLWMNGAFPVDRSDNENNFFGPTLARNFSRPACGREFRTALRLIAVDQRVEFRRVPQHSEQRQLRARDNTRSSFRRIHWRTCLPDRGRGRRDHDRWRAYIVADPRRPDRADAVLRADAGRGGAAAARVADARPRSARQAPTPRRV